jgi:predicted amidohydrolase
MYNTCIGFDRDGREIARYRKRHPWYPETWATPGEAPHPLVDIEGVRVTIAICFDIHFVDGSTLPEADVLLFPSAWVEEEDSRPTMLPALARRRHLILVNANWGPGMPRLPGQGDSCIVDSSGAMTRGDGRVDFELRV